MVEKSPGFTLLAHVTLILGVALIAFPLYVTLIASTPFSRSTSPFAWTQST